jgi:hypothetical protein
VLTLLAVLLFLAAGTFGTLWLLKQSDRGTATDQVTTTRAEVDDTTAKLKTAEADAAAAEKDLSDAQDARAKAWDIWDGDKQCATIARELNKAGQAGDVERMKTAVVDMLGACG